MFTVGSADLINKLRTDAQLIAQKSAVAALNDLETLFRYLTLFGVMDRVNRKVNVPFKYKYFLFLDNIRFKISTWFRLLYRCYI